MPRASTSGPDDGPQAPLSATDATSLWHAYRSRTNPEAVAAFDRLYLALRRPLVEFCKLRGCDSELADEVAERTWVRLIVRKPPATRSFIGLLRRTAQNLCHEARREVHESASLLDSATADNPAEVVERNDTIRAVRDCLSQLPPEDQAFLAYVHNHGLSQRAACELLGWRIAPSTCHQRYGRIRAALAGCLKKKGIF